MPGQQRSGDQAFVIRHFRANRQVETVPGQVTVVIVELQFDLHLGVLQGKFQQCNPSKNVSPNETGTVIRTGPAISSFSRAKA